MPPRLSRHVRLAGDRREWAHSVHSAGPPSYGLSFSPGYSVRRREVALAVTVVGLPVALAGAAAFLLLWFSAQSVAAAALAECPGPPRRLPFPVRLAAGFGVLFLLSLPGYGIGATASTLAGLVGLGAIMGVAVGSRST